MKTVILRTTLFIATLFVLVYCADEGDLNNTTTEDPPKQETPLIQGFWHLQSIVINKNGTSTTITIQNDNEGKAYDIKKEDIVDYNLQKRKAVCGKEKYKHENNLLSVLKGTCDAITYDVVRLVDQELILRETDGVETRTRKYIRITEEKFLQLVDGFRVE